MANRRSVRRTRRPSMVDLSNNQQDGESESSHDVNQHKRVFESEFINIEKKERIEKRWDITNTITIVEWVNACNLYVLVMDTYLSRLRSVLRVNTLWSLLISSITSTVSITQFTINESEYPLMSILVKGAIFLTSIITSLITGYIKVEKIQERIEQVDKTRYKWLQFLFRLTSELQVGAKLRNNAEELICNNRAEFNKLSSKRLEVPKYVERAVSLFLTKRARATHMRMIRENKFRFQKHETQLMKLGRMLVDKVCYGIGSDNHMHVEFAQQSLGIYKMNLELIKNELFLLAKIYSNVIAEIQFDHLSDILHYDIITTDVNLVKNNNIEGVVSYSPVSSDDESDSVTNEVVGRGKGRDGGRGGGKGNIPFFRDARPSRINIDDVNVVLNFEQDNDGITEVLNLPPTPIIEPSSIKMNIGEISPISTLKVDTISRSSTLNTQDTYEFSRENIPDFQETP